MDARRVMARILTILGVLSASYLLVTANSREWTLFLGHMQTMQVSAQSNRILAAILFFVIRFFFAVVSLPGTGLLTVAAGAIFGLWLGSLLVFASVSLGLLVAFLVSRYAFRDWLQSSLGYRFAFIQALFDEYGVGLLFMLRTIEGFPSFVINSGFALTSMGTRTYFWVSSVSIIPGVLVFTKAGARIAEIHRIEDAASASVLLAVGAMGALPLVGSILYRRAARRDPRWSQARASCVDHTTE